MTTEIRVPQLPESVADATLVAWHKQPGDTVSRDENLADLETDKVVLEVPAPLNGVIKEIRIQSGTTVTSGQVLAVIDEAAAGTSAASSSAAKAPASAAKSAPVAAAAVSTAKEGDGEAAKDAGKLSPSVRRLVEENRLDPGTIPASGKDGRLTKSDVVDFLGKHPNGGAAALSKSEQAKGEQTAAPSSAPAARAPAPVARPSTSGGRSE